MVHDNGNCKNLLLLNHHLIKNNLLHDVEKLNVEELYSFLIFFKNTKPITKILSRLLQLCAIGLERYLQSSPNCYD